jgi:hypothetical protein
MKLWTKPGTSLRERIQRMSEPNATGCWIWKAAVMGKGYGKLSLNGKLIGAHRASYIAFKGEIPAAAVIDHLCRVTSCVNPEHLEAVTVQQNTLRGNAPCAVLHGAEQCRYGHPYDAANTYIRPDGYRHCRACGRRNARKYQAQEAV